MRPVSGPHSSAPVVIQQAVTTFVASHLGSSIRYQLWEKVCCVNGVFSFFEVNMPFIKIKGPKPQLAADRLHKLGLHATPPA